MSDQTFEAPSLEYLAEHLPQYEFLGFIAQGGMGAVYKARQISLEREVAIKVLPHELGEDEEFRESFAKEARAMAKLNHPNLISVYDSGTVDGMPYIAMEYIEGSSLHDSCWGQVVDSQHAAAITKAICDGLADAHEHGIIHRDIKPANILLNAKAVPKIGDFGLAHPSDSEDSGPVMGTPGYTAPEVFHDSSQAGTLADIYSVGVILHQLLTGIDPTESQAIPSQATGNIRLDAIWRKATQYNPAQRYQSITEMAGDLQRWLDSKSGSLVVGSPAGMGGGGALSSPRASTAGLAPTRSGGGSGIMVKAVAAVAILAIGWFAFSALAGGDKDPKVANQDQPEAPTPQLPGTEAMDPAPSASSPTQDPVTHPVMPEPVDPVAIAPSPEPQPQPVVPDPVTPEPADPEPADPAPVVSTPDPEPKLPPGDPDLREKAVALIINERGKRNNLLLKNAKSLQFTIREEARHASGGEADFLKEFADACNDGWLARLDDVGKLGNKLALVYERCLKEEQSIESNYQAELTRIRDFYVPKLQGAAAECSDDQLKQRLIAQADRANDLTQWITSLAPEAERRIVNISVVAGGGDFVGTWDVVSDNESKWETKPDGSLTVIGPGWQGRWEIKDDGSLRVYFDGKKPYHLTRDGDAWSGRTGYDRPIRVTPAAGVHHPPRKMTADGGRGFAGRWEVTSDNFLVYDCRKDGTFVVENRGWTGTWKEQSDGSIQVQMKDKDPHFLRPKGDGVWEAPYRKDSVIRFVSVDSEHSVTSRKAGLASGERHARDFVGKWDSHTNTLMRWEADQDGTITIYDDGGNQKNWKGVWKAMPDDSIWVQISTKKPHEFVRNGRGWKNRIKDDIRLTPGNW